MTDDEVADLRRELAHERLLADALAMKLVSFKARLDAMAVEFEAVLAQHREARGR